MIIQISDYLSAQTGFLWQMQNNNNNTSKTLFLSGHVNMTYDKISHVNWVLPSRMRSFKSVTFPRTKYVTFPRTKSVTFPRTKSVTFPRTKYVTFPRTMWLALQKTSGKHVPLFAKNNYLSNYPLNEKKPKRSNKLLNSMTLTLM